MDSIDEEARERIMIEPLPLTVVTLNTWKGAGDYYRRIGLIGQALRRLRPDLVLLQETFAAQIDGVDTCAALARVLGMHHLHHPARLKLRLFRGRRVTSTSGMSILAKTVITSARRLPLPSDPSDGERFAQIATLTWNGTEIAVINAHLSPLLGGDPLRREQLRVIGAEITTNLMPRPVVLGGDFNADPESGALRWLKSQENLQVVDAWSMAGGPQPTLADPSGRIIGDRCVDYLCIIDHPNRRTMQVVNAERILDKPDPETGILPSDHCGVRAECTVSRPVVTARLPEVRTPPKSNRPETKRARIAN